MTNQVETIQIDMNIRLRLPKEKKPRGRPKLRLLRDLLPIWVEVETIRRKTGLSVREIFRRCTFRAACVTYPAPLPRKLPRATARSMYQLLVAMLHQEQAERDALIEALRRAGATMSFDKLPLPLASLCKAQLEAHLG